MAKQPSISQEQVAWDVQRRIHSSLDYRLFSLFHSLFLHFRHLFSHLTCRSLGQRREGKMDQGVLGSRATSVAQSHTLKEMDSSGHSHCWHLWRRDLASIELGSSPACWCQPPSPSLLFRAAFLILTCSHSWRRKSHCGNLSTRHEAAT